MQPVGCGGGTLEVSEQTQAANKADIRVHYIHLYKPTLIKHIKGFPLL